MNRVKISLLAATFGLAIVFTSCASKSKEAKDVPKNLDDKPTHELPCAARDDDEWFVATGVANGPRTRIDVMQGAALANAQGMIRQKMKYVYEGIVSDYKQYLGNNQGTDLDINNETGGDQIINLLVNETRVVCGPRFTEPDAKGHVEAYIGIKISKADFADKVADKIETMVPASERQRIEENKRNFQEYSANRIKAYKEK
jgi:hypothetical protein